MDSPVVIPHFEAAGKTFQEILKELLKIIVAEKTTNV